VIIISDATVLVNFALVDKFYSLKQLFKHIVVPVSVYNEVYGDGNHLPGSKEIFEAKREGWVEVVRYTNNVFYNRQGIRHLDAGEREAVTIAYEKGNGFLLTDDGDAIRACKMFLHLKNITYLSTIDVCKIMNDKKIIRMNYIEMSLKLRQLNSKYKFRYQGRTL